ncbi:MAG TPA: hypothetical protein VMG82_36910 [Candidatus Sulfotelmatobacter sp.]|nr:hypothetical protein [Candidatus Sulfotelmatobacter sp.]
MTRMPVDFSGTWVADLSTSIFRGPQPASLRLNISHSEPELREELVFARPDGIEDHSRFVCQTTGDDGTCLLNNIPIPGCACWVKQELVIETRIRLAEREVYLCDCWSLSSDEETLVMEHRNDALAGQRVVFKRFSPA